MLNSPRNSVVQLTLEQHRCELRGATDVQIFFPYTQDSAVNIFSLHYDFLNVFLSLAYFIAVRTQYVIQNVCESPVYVIGKAFSQQQAMSSEVLAGRSYT